MDSLSKQDYSQLCEQGVEALHSSRFEEAISLYRRILSVYPKNIAALNNLGLALLGGKDYEEAIDVFCRAIAVDHGIAQLHYNLGLGLHKLNRLEEAIQSYGQAIQLDTGYKEALQNMGAALKGSGKIEEAITCYQRLLELGPENTNAKYMLDSLLGTQGQQTAPREYVTDLFNDYADHFEEQLVHKLEYHIPSELKQALVSFLEPSVHFLHLLDLGCGTGLVGETFHTLTQELTGVDLSEKMLDQARKKKIYTQLYEADITGFLKQVFQTGESEKYDLVVAADVLVYLGVLDPIFEGLARCMKPGGYLLFSTEDNPDLHCFILLQSGRYGHSPMYVQSVCQKNGFLFRLCRPARIRKDGGKWLTGNIYILQFTGSRPEETE